MKISSSSEDSLSCSFCAMFFLRVALRGLYMSWSQSGRRLQKKPSWDTESDMLVLLLPCFLWPQRFISPKPTWLSLVPELLLCSRNPKKPLGGKHTQSVSRAAFRLSQCVCSGLTRAKWDFSQQPQWAKSPQTCGVENHSMHAGLPEALRVCPKWPPHPHLWGDLCMWLSMAYRHDCNPTHISRPSANCPRAVNTLHNRAGQRHVSSRSIPH